MKQSFQRVSIFAVIFSLVVTGCASGAATPTSPPTVAPLLRVSGSGGVMPLVQKLADAYGLGSSDIQFQFNPGTDTGGAITGVLQGTLDLALGNRPLSSSEAAQPLDYTPFARDAIVFAVKLPNTVTGLSTAQIQDIYGGKLTNWSEVGAAAAPLVVLDRDLDESARKLVFLPLMNGRAVQARTIVLSKVGDMIQALEKTPNSIGYSPFGLLQMLQPKEIRILALDGVVPSTNSIAQKTYPWQLTFGLISRREPSPAVRRFIDFVMSAKGRQVMGMYGYVTLN